MRGAPLPEAVVEEVLRVRADPGSRGPLSSPAAGGGSPGSPGWRVAGIPGGACRSPPSGNRRGSYRIGVRGVSATLGEAWENVR